MKKNTKEKNNKNKNDGRKTSSVQVSTSTNIERRFDIDNKPQFRKVNEKSNKIVLDDRFASAITDPRFQLDIKDKYGRDQSRKGSSSDRKQAKSTLSFAQEQLSEFYTIEEKETDNSIDKINGNDKKKTNRKVDKDNRNKNDNERQQVKEQEDDNDNEADNDDDTDDDPVSRINYLRALSRGEIDVSSSSSSSDEDDDEDALNKNDDDSVDDLVEDEEDDYTIKAGVLDPSTNEYSNVELTTEQSNYLAIMNLDWSHISAVDVYMIVQSFTPPNSIKNVTIYPSNFGLERMAHDEKFGPPTAVWKDKKRTSNLATTISSSSSSNTSEDGNMNQQSDNDDDASDDSNDVDVEPAEDDDEDEDEDSVIEMKVGNSYDDHMNSNEMTTTAEGGFDPEKLRAYEASKLKYYFAVVEFMNTDYTDVAYKEIDGIEFEHSSAALDARIIPMNEIQTVIANRTIRDEATASSVPSNYTPPDFIVTALQQSNVSCSWEVGDAKREKTLTKYTTGQAWEAMAESDDLKAYLASDDSSYDDDDNSSKGDNSIDGGRQKTSAVTTNSDKNSKKKDASRLRKMLGLDDDSDDNNENESDDDDDGNNNRSSSTCSNSTKEDEGESDDKERNSRNNDVDSGSVQSESSSSSEANSIDDDDIHNKNDGDKEFVFVPDHERSLAPEMKDKTMPISREQQQQQKQQKELTPWEKFLQKKKDKRKEKRQATREKRKEISTLRKGGKLKKIDGDKSESENDNDSYDDSDVKGNGKQQSQEELELLFAGDGNDDDDKNRDFDMRGVQRIDRNKDRKLRGTRKRKEDQLASTVVGTDFTVDCTDNRFSKLLDGSDPRYGIDRTDPNYKETPGMRDILKEQTHRRKKRKQVQQEKIITVNSETGTKNIDPTSNVTMASSKLSSDVILANVNKSEPRPSALSALVSNLKAKVK